MKSVRAQNKIFTIGFLLIVLIIIWSLAHSYVLNLRKTDDQKSEEKINAEILKAPLETIDELYHKITNKDKIFVFDLRNAGDFASGHIVMSYSLASSEINKAKIEQLGAAGTSEIFLTNQGSDVFETAQKTNELIAAGFPNVKYLQGGIAAWKSAGYALISSGGSSSDSVKIKKINISDLASDLAAGADLIQFLDVRDESAYKLGHIPNAVNVSLLKLEFGQDKLSALAKVVIYGDSDDQASHAAVALFDLNFPNAYVLDGGLDAWKAAGGQMDSDN